MDLIKLCKDNSASILTGLGVMGVFSTAVMTAKATPKAIALLEEKEEFKMQEYGEPLTKFEKFIAAAPAYIPATLMGIGACACILGAHKIHLNREASLISSYTALESIYHEYRRKVTEVCGEDTARYIDAEIEKEERLIEQYGSPTEPVLFYDEYSNRYFEMSTHELLKAIESGDEYYQSLKGN